MLKYSRKWKKLCLGAKEKQSLHIFLPKEKLSINYNKRCILAPFKKQFFWKQSGRLFGELVTVSWGDELCLKFLLQKLILAVVVWNGCLWATMMIDETLLSLSDVQKVAQLYPSLPREVPSRSMPISWEVWQKGVMLLFVQINGKTTWHLYWSY